VTLLCFFTVGSELEALLGNGVYWALLCLSVVAGGFADAALSPQVGMRVWRARVGLAPAGGCCLVNPPSAGMSMVASGIAWRGHRTSTRQRQPPSS
jgi:membrane associated rhomboid family serine protease